MLFKTTEYLRADRSLLRKKDCLLVYITLKKASKLRAFHGYFVNVVIILSYFLYDASTLMIPV
jgi:hypothetical protein